MDSGGDPQISEIRRVLLAVIPLKLEDDGNDYYNSQRQQLLLLA